MIAHTFAFVQIELDIDVLPLNLICLLRFPPLSLPSQTLRRHPIHGSHIFHIYDFHTFVRVGIYFDIIVVLCLHGVVFPGLLLLESWGSRTRESCTQRRSTAWSEGDDGSECSTGSSTSRRRARERWTHSERAASRHFLYGTRRSCPAPSSSSTFSPSSSSSAPSSTIMCRGRCSGHRFLVNDMPHPTYMSPALHASAGCTRTCFTSLISASAIECKRAASEDVLFLASDGQCGHELHFLCPCARCVGGFLR